MLRNCGALAGFAFALVFPAFADSITISGRQYQDVNIVESERMYYIKIPATGKTLAIKKDELSIADVQISTNKAEREERDQKWRKKISTELEKEIVRPEKADSDQPLQRKLAPATNQNEQNEEVRFRGYANFSLPPAVEAQRLQLFMMQRQDAQAQREAIATQQRQRVALQNAKRQQAVAQQNARSRAYSSGGQPVTGGSFTFMDFNVIGGKNIQHMDSINGYTRGYVPSWGGEFWPGVSIP